MKEPYYCPAEGCGYGTESDKSLAAVRSHINAMGDDHDWDTLKPLLHEQGESNDDQPDDQPDDHDEDPPGTGGAAATDEDGDDDQQTEGVEQTETPENEENDQQDMDQSNEYQQQIEQAEQPESSDEGSQTATGQGDTSSQTTSGRGVPVVPIVAGVLLLGLLLVALSGDDDQPAEVDSEVVEESEQADPVTDEPEADPAWQ
ncbi:hypothetical protein ACOZ4F_14950 [Haloarcula marismortui]|uniref:hypothetical protein n=1 Tax=Haloarcula marismortui TaxID=2238 RepID=UPI003C709F36